MHSPRVFAASDDTWYRRDAEGAGSLPGPRPWLLLIALCPPTAVTTGSGTGPRSLATAWFYSRGRRRHGWSQRHWHATAPLSRATFADRQAPDLFVFVVWFQFVVFSPSTKCLEMCESPVSFPQTWSPWRNRGLNIGSVSNVTIWQDVEHKWV